MELFSETPFMKRIRGGPLITDVYQQMVKKQNGSLPHNFAIYSAHDSTLVNVMRALNVDDQTTTIPDYGATLAFELHCRRDDDCYVRVSGTFTKLKFGTFYIKLAPLLFSNAK